MGIAIAAPVGPIGVLCIQRTLTQGRIAGIITGLGAACADLIYGLIAGLGLTFISRFLISHHMWIQLLGGIFLMYLGVRTVTKQAHGIMGKAIKKNLMKAFFTTFAQTLTNPITILSFTAIFAGLGISDSQAHAASALYFVTGIFFGSSLWWLLLTTGVSLFQKKISPRALVMINYGSGIIIMLFGAFSLLHLI